MELRGPSVVVVFVVLVCVVANGTKNFRTPFSQDSLVWSRGERIPHGHMDDFDYLYDIRYSAM